ncbi:MAG: hypothetical protein LBB10_03335 [Bifidobacteriaceae bacterium]|jgi:hypothetical protein|nr:hypothetical protein [Bifidobacteriaceae bacterium]
MIKVNDLKLSNHKFHARRTKVFNPTNAEFDRVVKKAVYLYKANYLQNAIHPQNARSIPKVTIQDIPDNLNNEATPYFSLTTSTFKSKKSTHIFFYRFPVVHLVSSSEELFNLVNNVILNVCK